MSDQLSLELVIPPIRAVRSRLKDPATSTAAAERVTDFDSHHFGLIRDALRKAANGLTCHELAAATGLTNVQVARRLPELEAANIVAVLALDGIDVTRKSPSGRPCRVWRAA